MATIPAQRRILVFESIPLLYAAPLGLVLSGVVFRPAICAILRAAGAGANQKARRVTRLLNAVITAQKVVKKLFRINGKFP
jgi:hypothetical protein